MTDIILYGHRDSGHAFKVALALSLSGIAHERRTIDIWAAPATRPADFLQASPFAEVPLLRVGDTALIQSASILMAIADMTDALGPVTPRCREILFWEANRIGMCLPQLIEHRRNASDPLLSDAVAWLRARYAADLNRFALLLGDRAFLGGASPDIADCAVMGYAQWHDRAGVDPSPAMVAWLGRMRAHPGFQTAEAFFPD